MTSRAGRGSSESAVPQGLPHGERKRTIDARRQAGLATTNRDSQNRAATVQGLANTPAVRAATPARQGFDALLELDPARVQPMFGERNAAIAEAAQPVSLRDRLAQTAEASNNDFLRGVVQRVQVRRGGQ